MVRVRRRYATQMVFPPLFPALKGRAIFRGRYAAKNDAALGVSPARCCQRQEVCNNLRTAEDFVVIGDRRL
jgi:hypothetical protein